MGEDWFHPPLASDPHEDRELKYEHLLTALYFVFKADICLITFWAKNFFFFFDWEEELTNGLNAYTFDLKTKKKSASSKVRTC